MNLNAPLPSRLSRRQRGGCLLLALCWPGVVFAFGDLKCLPDGQPQRVFAGDARGISVIFYNPTVADNEWKLHARVFQTSSSTAVWISEEPWQRLAVPANETVLESVRLDFPAVRAETKFLVQWVAGSNQVVGSSEIWVYPTNLFHDLKSLLGEGILGVLDPNDQLKPLLEQNGVTFQDLGEMALEDFRGKLAVVGPFQSKAQIRGGLALAIERIARKGVAVVWMQPPAPPDDEVKPSFYTVPEGKGAVVIVQPELVADLSENPKSQLNLIYFCKLALHPAPPQLPNLFPEP
jgi:hypothetical protein